MLENSADIIKGLGAQTFQYLTTVTFRISRTHSVSLKSPSPSKGTDEYEGGVVEASQDTPPPAEALTPLVISPAGGVEDTPPADVTIIEEGRGYGSG